MTTGRRLAMLSLTGVIAVASGAAASDCDPWTLVGSLPFDHRPQALEYGGDTWVVVGRSGAVAASADGATWTVPGSVPTTADLRGVAWGNGEFLAVGAGVVLSGSADGSAWTVVAADPTWELYGVAWSGDVWIAVGGDALVLRSSDGRVWEPVDTPATATLRDVTYSFAGFVAVGQDGHVLTSPDGWWWNLQPPVPAEMPDWLLAVAAGPDRLVAAGGAAFGLIVSSSDGACWSTELEGAGGRDWLTDVAWGEPGFVAVGGIVADVTVPWATSSRDGREWTGGSAPGSSAAQTVAWGQRRWLMVLSDGDVLSSGICFTRWIQVVAGLPGAFGSRWRSDLTVRNPGDAAVHVELVFDPAGAGLSIEADIAAGAQAVWEDVVGSSFGVEGKAPLRVRSDGRVAVATRLANVAEDGTFGQWMPGVDVVDAVVAGHPVQLLHLRQLEDTFRTNLTFANLSRHSATVAVELFASDGMLLDRHELTLAAGELVQELQPFVTLAGAPDLGWGFAEVSAVSGTGVVVTASVIDSRTNDAVTVVPEPTAAR